MSLIEPLHVTKIICLSLITPFCRSFHTSSTCLIKSTQIAIRNNNLIKFDKFMIAQHVQRIYLVNVDHQFIGIHFGREAEPISGWYTRCESPGKLSLCYHDWESSLATREREKEDAARINARFEGRVRGIIRQDFARRFDTEIRSRREIAMSRRLLHPPRIRQTITRCRAE